MKSRSSPPPFNEVIDRTLEDFLNSIGAAGFDKCQIEKRILSTPEFRRIHDIQMQYLEDIDLETPIIDYARNRVYCALNEHVGPDGEMDLIEILAKRTDGDRFTWYRLDVISTAALLTILRTLIEDETQRPVQENAARIARLTCLIEQRQEGRA
jgi:hypothetical protein